MRTKEAILESYLGAIPITEVDGVRVTSHIEKAMDEYAKEIVIDVINYLKRQGVIWNANNASTPAEELFDLYQQERSSLK